MWIAKVIAMIQEGIVIPDSVDSASIVDGSIQMEDLSDDVKQKLGASVDEEEENAIIG